VAAFTAEPVMGAGGAILPQREPIFAKIQACSPASTSSPTRRPGRCSTRRRKCRRSSNATSKKHALILRVMGNRIALPPPVIITESEVDELF
jgi:adenosylmethionine-8-amino-7-oxononanoate aminotransferase